MRYVPILMRRQFLILFLALSTLAFGEETEDWLTFKKARLLEAKYMDGDSFQVKVKDGKKYTLRLYAVDCAEDNGSFPKRITAQKRHFQIEKDEVLYKYADKATEFTKKFLRSPFTFHTKMVDARGNTAGGRIYAIIENKKGERLDEELVKRGLARVYGRPADWPEGTGQSRAYKKLKELEKKAKRKKKGLWRHSDKKLRK